MSAAIKTTAIKLSKSLLIINVLFGLAYLAYLTNNEPAYGYFGVHDNVVYAAREGNVSQVRFLSTFDGMLSRTGFEEHYTPLTAATRWRHANVVRFLLKKGVNVHSRDDFLRTPLSIARQNKDGEISGLLVEAGARY